VKGDLPPPDPAEDTPQPEAAKTGAADASPAEAPGKK